MIYECDQCSKALPPGVSACPSCGEVFDDVVPADAEVPKRGFSAVSPKPEIAAIPASGADDAERRRRSHLVNRSGGSYDWLDAPAARPNEGRVPEDGSPGLWVFGVLLLIAGLALAGYFFLAFDTSVTTPQTTILGTTIGGERVNNIGLMADRQNGIIIGMGAAILGTILMYAGRSKR